jgi:hypothetical protein
LFPLLLENHMYEYGMDRQSTGVRNVELRVGGMPHTPQMTTQDLSGIEITCEEDREETKTIDELDAQDAADKVVEVIREVEAATISTMPIALKDLSQIPTMLLQCQQAMSATISAWPSLASDCLAGPFAHHGYGLWPPLLSNSLKTASDPLYIQPSLDFGSSLPIPLSQQSFVLAASKHHQPPLHPAYC